MIPLIDIPRDRPGQCPACGAFRTDGQPVTVHFHGCGLGPHGLQVGPVRAGGDRWREWAADRERAAAADRAPRTRTRNW
jgi:hypothetical protein